ncbi:DUF348 domain-containing protein [Schaalia sp. ZJ405]|nr:DUF348 domain-containing protein [Schaalia sp. ZJ405]
MLEVNGVTRPVTVWNSHVDSVLAAAGITVGPHDLVQPSAEETVPNGGTVIVRTASPHTLSVDGRVKTVWSTSESADAILADAGYSGTQVALAADRSSTRPTVTSLVARPRPVSVIVDGHETTTQARPGQQTHQVLESAGVKVSPLDRVSVSTADDGQLVVSVARVSRGEATQTQSVPFTQEDREDAQMFVGESQVTTLGVNGSSMTTVWEEKADDAVVHRVETSVVNLVEPTTQIRSVGTKDVTPEALVAAGIDPKAKLEEKTEADGTTSVRYRAKLGSLSTPEELAQYVSGSEAADLLAAAQSAGVPLTYSGEDPRSIAQGLVSGRGWSSSEFQCLVTLWNRESGWNPYAANPSSGAYGIPQALPGTKMASAGADWRTNPATQITWGLGYIAGRYGTPCSALGHSNSVGWY